MRGRPAIIGDAPWCDAAAPASIAAACVAWRERGGLPAASVSTLDVLAGLDDDPETLAAAMWFDLARVFPSAWEAVAANQNDTLRRLVEGQQAAERVFSLHADAPVRERAEGLRRLLLAMVRDLRVVFILLSRQLAQLRAASELPAAERLALALQTADLHAPLANRLGIWQVKWELEDLAFRHLEPETYRRVAALLDERRDDRERWIARARLDLESALREAAIDAEVAGRPKHIYSIWKKMQRKAAGFSDLYDIRALRVIVEDVPACYAALGVVHQLWVPIPSEFDDYIARPKANGYRSLHTAVAGPQGRTLEVQIRTREMHRLAELGVAAHWRYKEGGGAGDAAFEARIAWMRGLLEQRGDEDGSLVEAFRTDLLEDRIYVLTPKGEVVDLPRGATVLDFAYHVHTEVGHRCRGAKVNGRIVPLAHIPVSGDRIEILTGKQAQPSRDWLSPQHGYLHSGRAREKVRSWFRRVEHTTNLEAGRVILDRELRRLALPSTDVECLPDRLGLKSIDELLEALALGEVGVGQLARAAHDLHGAPQPAAPVASPALTSVRRDGLGALTIEGVGNLLTQLARCCQPLPGDPVKGYVTRSRGVSVHRADCKSLARLAARQPERIIQVAWGRPAAGTYQADIRVDGYERKELLKDVTSVITQSGAAIIASSSERQPDRGEVQMRFSLRVRDFAQLGQLLARLSALPNVREARRLAGA